VVPGMGDVYRLAAGTPAKRIKTGEPDLREATGRDWQNNYASFATSLKHELAQIDDAKARRQAIEDMRTVLECYKRATDRQKKQRVGGRL